MPGEADSGPDFRTFFQAGPGLLMVVDPDLVVLAASDAALRATKRRRDEVIGRDLYQAFPVGPDDAEGTGRRRSLASMDRVRRELAPDTMPVVRHDIRGPGGTFEELYWSVSHWPILDGSGELAYILIRFEDVTQFVRLTRGGAREEGARELKAHVARMEAEILARSEELGRANDALRAARGADQLAARDRARLEAQVHRSQRLEGLGQLAGGVAHEFNNLLGVITGYSSFIAEELAAAAAEDAGRWQPVSDDLGQVRDATGRATELVRQMLTFGRREVIQPRPVDLNQTITDLAAMLGRTVGEHVIVHTDLDPGLLMINADPAQLEQVLVNLTLNARDAMPGGGTLTITTRNHDGEITADGEGLRTVRLTVTDTGTGMAPEIAARAFEPFFTTKPMATHSGLGLAVVHGVVGRGGGDVTVDAAVGAGTSVTASFPALTDDAPRAAAPPAPTDTQAGTETILAVDDEPGVLDIARRLLARHGYHVHTAASGTEACDHARRYDGELDLLLTDVVMPGMHGHEVADQVRRIRPGIKVLYMSGYDRQTLTRQGVLRPGVTLIAKPFGDAALTATVHDVLTGQA